MCSIFNIDIPKFIVIIINPLFHKPPQENFSTTSSSFKIFTNFLFSLLRKRSQLQPGKRVQNSSSPPKEAVFFEKSPYTCAKSIIGRPFGVDHASLPRTRRNGGCMQHTASHID